MNTYSLFITCPRGLETILAGELSAQHCTDLQPTEGGIACKGTLEQVYRINLYSRTASRVLLQLAQARYRNEQDIYQLARRVQWQNWFGVKHTFKVKVEGKRAQVKRLDIVGLKIKDALCDAFREQTGERPSVDKQRPDVRVHAFIDEQTLRIFIDTSGEALFKRGYRQDTG